MIDFLVTYRFSILEPKSRFTKRAARLVILLWLSAFTFNVDGQDLENIKKEDLFRYSGGLSFTNTFYHAQGAATQRDPYFWQLNANLTLNFLNIISAPFSFTISQQSKNFSQPQPFNRFGISPTYKGLTLHLGHRSINFSDYTLAGNLFFGVGVEYKPQTNPLRLSALYGRFAKPVNKFSQDGQVFAEPTYRRIGFGLKAGFELEKQRAAIMFFKSQDDINSITLPDSLTAEETPTPEENLAVGFEVGFKFLDRFSFDGEYAYSLFSRDTRVPELFIDDYSFINNLGGAFTPNASSVFTNAFKSQLAFQGDLFQLTLGYRRVDPGYATHGSSFLNNDLQDITAGISLPLFNNKVSLSGSIGMQNNNLNGQNEAEIRRFIYSSSVSIMATEKLSFNVNYSNFSTSTRQLLLRTDILSDTLEFFQVSKSLTGSVNYQLGGESKRSALFLSCSFQDASDNQANASQFLSGNTGISFGIGEKWTTTTSATYNQSEASGFTSATYGPVLAVGRPFFKNKLRTNLSWSMLSSRLNGEQESNINNIRFSTNWSPGKRHSFSANAFYVIREIAEEQGTDIKEIRATINYNFRI